MKKNLLISIFIYVASFGLRVLAAGEDQDNLQPYCATGGTAETRKGCIELDRFHTEVNDREATVIVSVFVSKYSDLEPQYGTTISSTNNTTRYILYTTKQEAMSEAKKYIAEYSAAVVRNSNSH